VIAGLSRVCVGTCARRRGKPRLAPEGPSPSHVVLCIGDRHGCGQAPPRGPDRSLAMTRTGTFEARKRLVQTCQQTGSVRRTAALWHTSRQVVRKRVRRYEQDGEDGLHDRSCRPDHCPHQTREATEEPGRRGTESHRLWARTPGPLSRSARGPGLSPYHPSHPASSSLTREKHKRRKPLYPAHWAWNVKEPFALIQTDAKDILDKGALETRRWQHIRT